MVEILTPAQVPLLVLYSLDLPESVLTIQNLPYASWNLLHIEGFLDKTIATSLQYLGCLSIDAVTTWKEDFNVWVNFLVGHRFLLHPRQA